jgi:hypothetical protein
LPWTCPAAQLEPPDAAALGDVRRIRLTLAGPGEPPQPAPVAGVDPAESAGGDERYRLMTGAAGITWTARTQRGILRAAASAAQLVGSGGQFAHLQVVA